MNHGMAIRANRNQIDFWSDLTRTGRFGKWVQVMYVNEPFAQAAVRGGEVNSTDYAADEATVILTIVFNAKPSGHRISFAFRSGCLTFGTFHEWWCRKINNWAEVFRLKLEAS